MERKISDELLKWKVDSYRKPMLLYGISGCGKTYSALSFGNEEYKNTIYFDCNNNLELSYVFDKNTTVDKLVRGLSAISLETIFKGESLIIFDNVNEKILKSVLALFATGDYHIIMITNDFSFVSFCKGKSVVLKKMTLVTFFEYLKFIGKEQMIAFIEDSFKTDKPMPFHSLAMEIYNEYVICGGYPVAICSYNENDSYNFLSSIHERNVILLKNKLFLLDNLIDIKRSSDIFNNVAIQLLKGNRKFVYGMVKSGARSKEYSRCLDFMENNNMVIKSVRLNEIVSPISKGKDQDNFKLYYNDSGILYKRLNVSGNRLITNDKLLELLYESNIVETLSRNGFNIYHYHSGGKAFIDIVIQTRTGKILPIEIIHGEESAKSKSMTLSMRKYNLSLGIRLSNEDFKLKNNIKYIPYYAAFCIVESL